VTFDAVWPPAGPPTATLNGTTLEGVSHPYAHFTAEEGRNYTLHFVRFPDLIPGATYSYSVRGPNGTASDEYAFRAPRQDGTTRLAAYGDLGHSEWSAMTNLKEDCLAGVIDAVVMLGDHAYDMGNANGLRGAAYMNAFQPTLASCPWLPIVGNHEGNDGDDYMRYLNMTFGTKAARRHFDGAPRRASRDSFLLVQP